MKAIFNNFVEAKWDGSYLLQLWGSKVRWKLSLTILRKPGEMEAIFKNFEEPGEMEAIFDNFEGARLDDSNGSYL